MDVAVVSCALLFSPQEGYRDLLVDPVRPAENVVRVFCFRDVCVFSGQQAT